jgi:uncharacterized protein YndB with AHSA1/START domain
MSRATVDILSDTEVLIRRTFDAERELVFEAITSPEHVPHWYGCDTLKMIECTIDLRVGGKWRYVLRTPDGGQHAFSGEYREIVPPSRLVSTESYEPIGPGHEMVATVTLEAKNGRTLFRNHLQYKSKADRDGHLGAGMEKGMQEAFDRLDALVTQRSARRA